MASRRRLRCKTTVAAGSPQRSGPQTPPPQAPAETAPRRPETSEDYWPVRTANFDIAYAVNMLAAAEENKTLPAPGTGTAYLTPASIGSLLAKAT